MKLRSEAVEGHRYPRSRALDILNPITVRPDLVTCLLLNPRPKSHTRCLTPLMQWKVNGSAAVVFSRTFAATGRVPKDAAMDVESMCQPNQGEAAYAAKKR